MKRDTQIKVNGGFALLLGGFVLSAPALAHSEAVAHPVVSGPAHGMIHALISVPVVAGVTALGLLLVWPLFRLGKNKTQAEPGLKQE